MTAMIFSRANDGHEGFLTRRVTPASSERKTSDEVLKGSSHSSKRSVSTTTVASDSDDPPDTCWTLHHLRPTDVLREYSEEALVHGVHYFTKKELCFVESYEKRPDKTEHVQKDEEFRFGWIVAVAVCGVFAALFVHVTWIKFINSPIVTSVETTFYPLYKIPFPAVTICNANNVRRAEAERLLLRHLKVSGEPNTTLSKQLWHVMSALSKLQSPFYQAMTQHLREARQLLPRLADLNISWFMREVMPTCQEMFHTCYWQGNAIDCCTEFHFQRYEGGFCYSFNSLTADDMQDCETPIYSEDPASGNTSECFLRHNTACGTATGLEVYLKLTKQNEQLLQEPENSGVRVMIHSPDTFPEDGRSLFVDETTEPATGGVFKISPSFTESSYQTRKLSPDVRLCYYPDERHLLVSSDYTYDNCLIQCRMLHLAHQCGCVPYFLAHLLKVPECNITRLDCVIFHSPNLRFFRPPPGARGFKKVENQRSFGLNCSDCLPACHDSKYDTETSITRNFKFPLTNVTYLDIFYKDLGAVKYSRDLSFGQTELLVALGGIVSLFLGVSLLSCVEVFYYIIKLVAVLACGLRGQRVAPSKASAPPAQGPTLILQRAKPQQESGKGPYSTLEQFARAEATKN